MPSQSVELTGIPTSESFGALPTGRSLYPLSIPTGEEIGTLTPNVDIQLTGIATAEDVGEPSLVHYVQLTSINSNEHVVSPSVDAQIPPPEIPISNVVRALGVGERFSNPIVNQNQTTDLKL